MVRLDRAIALFIALPPMARSSRSMTLWCPNLQRFWVLAEIIADLMKDQCKEAVEKAIEAVVGGSACAALITAMAKSTIWSQGTPKRVL
jgi:hypothetical protein